MAVHESQEMQLKELEKQCPLSTDLERQRFLKGCDGNLEKATKRLRKYLEWRAQHVTNDRSASLPKKEETSDDSASSLEEKETSDKTDWEDSVREALVATKFGQNQKRRRKRQFDETNIPQIVMLHENEESGEPVTEREGSLLFHVLPAQFDRKLVDSGIYELAIALYLERKLDRDCLQQGTVLLDVRPGKGFHNASALILMPFIQRISKFLNQKFPERLHRCILYPLPRPALWLWHMASSLLDDNVTERIILIAGDFSIEAPPPNEDLAQYIDESVLEQVECARLDAFVDT